MTKQKRIKLSQGLEQSLLKAISQGLTAPSSLDLGELSKVGRAVLKATRHLLDNGASTPLEMSAIYITSKKIFGGDESTLTEYLSQLQNLNLGDDAVAVIQTLKDKDTLVQLVNEAGNQLTEGTSNFVKLGTMITERGVVADGKDNKSVAELVGEEFPPPPHGPPLESLPKISRTSNGMCGIWALGGDPGVGKSTLGWQISVEMNKHMPVVYYDIDGTGFPWFVEKGRKVFGNMRDFKENTSQIYFRSSMNSFDADVMRLRPPALFVIDSVQTLPTDVRYRRNSLDSWLRTFKGIYSRGFTFLLISEVGRNNYGEPSLGAFKETGAIEYACSYGAILNGDEEDEDEPIKFTIVKNRHNKKKGYLTDLDRDSEKVHWFNEEGR